MALNIIDNGKYSPNRDNSGFRKPIDLIILHWFGTGTFESALATFMSDASDVSAHYVISDKKIVRVVPESDVAWHGGNYPANQRSIGIEHDAIADKKESNGTITPGHNASDDTYETSAQLVADICKRYGIPCDSDHIKGHKDFKATQCPGTLDLNRIINRARVIMGLNKSECEIALEEMRESRNRHKAEKAEIKAELDTTKTELDNRVEQVERLKQEKAAEIQLRETLLKDKGEIVAVYENRLTEKQGEVDALAKEKGQLTTQLTKLSKELENLNSMPRDITVSEAFSKIFDSIVEFLKGRHGVTK